MKAKRFMENAIHGFFLLMGLVTVGCVLLIYRRTLSSPASPLSVRSAL